MRFDLSDIRLGAAALDVECNVKNGKQNERYGYFLGKPREQAHDTPVKAEFVKESLPTVNGNEPGGRPLAVLFSINRAIPSARALAKGAAAGGTDAAFWGALSNRRALCLGEFEAWMRVQRALSSERPAAKRVLAAFEEAVARFLPGYKNLRLGGESPSGSFLLIDCGTTTLPVRLLSDGERGVLAMVLDLTRRFAQANPAMEDPASEAEAVVLIDEIELHLHPKWQRQIVHKLRTTFPLCQFIATTHSPQVIGEVEGDRIQIIADGEVYSPTHSFGVDSSRVLEEILDVAPRAREIQTLLTSVSREVSKQRYEKARRLLAQLVERLGENDPEVTRIRTLLGLIEGEE